MPDYHSPENCPVCLGDQLHFAFDCRDHSISGEVFQVWHCNACTHRFTWPVPSSHDLPRYYQAPHYISHTNTSEGFISRLYKLARWFTLRGKRNLVSRLVNRKSGRLLDVGCGTGAFLHTMQQAGWQVQGLEPDTNARKKAQELYGLKPGEPEELFILPGGSFHAITLWHVLEHVATLQAYFAQFDRLLAPDGVLIVAVPNYTSYDAGYYQQWWAAYDIPRHLHHFSPWSMEKLANAAGFSITQKKPMLLDAFYIALLSEQYKHGHSRPVAAFFRGLFAFFKTLTNKHQCSSLIYIMKKEAAK